MKTYHSRDEVKKDIVNDVLRISDDIEIAFDGFNIDADIICHNIYFKDSAGDIKARNISAGDIKARDISAWDIKAGDIKAWDITAGDIKARNITAWNIKAGDIKAWDITAENISAGDIKAWDITAWDIKAGDIKYFAFCIAYNNIRCRSIKGTREGFFHKCFDGKLIIENEKHIIKLDGKEIELSDESYENIKNQFKE